MNTLYIYTNIDNRFKKDKIKWTKPKICGGENMIRSTATLQTTDGI